IQLDDKTSDPDAATQLKADDEFLLTPLEEAAGEESDSGSQVMALDADVDFDESAATMLGPSAALSGVTALEDDLGASMGDLGGLSAGPVLTPTPTMVAAVATVPDITFQGWQVALLTFSVIFLTLCGIMMFDLIRNMWGWEGTFPVNSSLM